MLQCQCQPCSIFAFQKHEHEWAYLVADSINVVVTAITDNAVVRCLVNLDLNLAIVSNWDEGVAFRSGQVVYDLVYNPPQTRLLQKATNDGAQAIGGLGMLIWQGALAFERWTGQLPPVAVMREAAEAVFAQRRAT